MKEAILYLLNVRINELRKIHNKQFKAKDFRKLDMIEEEIKQVEEKIEKLRGDVR